MTIDQIVGWTFLALAAYLVWLSIYRAQGPRTWFRRTPEPKSEPSTVVPFERPSADLARRMRQRRAERPDPFAPHTEPAQTWGAKATPGLPRAERKEHAR